MRFKTFDARKAHTSVDRWVKYGFVHMFGTVILPLFACGQASQVGVVGVPSDATQYPIPGVGSVNLNNGNLHIDIPLWTAKARNGATITQSLVYDNSTYTIVQVPVSGGTGTYAGDPDLKGETKQSPPAE